VALAAPAARVEPTEDAFAPPHVDEGREASPPWPVEAAKTLAPVAKPVSAEAVIGEEGTSPPGLVEVEVEGVKARIAQESAVHETVARATTVEIQVAEETGVFLSQSAVGGEARTLELVCTSWAPTSGLDAVSEDDEEAASRHTLERGMTWVRRAFDELILLATSVSYLVKDSFLIPRSSRDWPVILVLLAVGPRVFRSEARPRRAPTPRGADPAGDAACRGPGSRSWCCGERDVRTGIP
jgi:hypothetical protein